MSSWALTSCACPCSGTKLVLLFDLGQWLPYHDACSSPGVSLHCVGIWDSVRCHVCASHTDVLICWTNAKSAFFQGQHPYPLFIPPVHVRLCPLKSITVMVKVRIALWHAARNGGLMVQRCSWRPRPSKTDPYEIDAPWGDSGQQSFSLVIRFEGDHSWRWGLETDSAVCRWWSILRRFARPVRPIVFSRFSDERLGILTRVSFSTEFHISRLQMYMLGLRDTMSTNSLLGPYDKCVPLSCFGFFFSCLLHNRSINRQHCSNQASPAGSDHSLTELTTRDSY